LGIGKSITGKKFEIFLEYKFDIGFKSFADNGLGSIDKMFMVLGKDTGFSKNYDHVGMVVSREAQHEVWPDVAGWLRDRV